MRISLCTISFRHHLISMDELAQWAQLQRFQGIELWGAHAKNLASRPEYNARWLQSFGLNVSMLSDYLPLDVSEQELHRKLDVLCDLAQRWGTTKLRTFAGQLSSAQATAAERALLVQRLRLACESVSKRGLRLLVETHPRTLADSVASTSRLLAEVAHPALRINFDVLHLWEAGDEPLAALDQLWPYVAHFHLKNVSAKHLLGVFAPANVYAAAGSREGMVPLFEGAFDYQKFLRFLVADPHLDASLEWFGNDVQQTLCRDRERLRALESVARAPTRPRASQTSKTSTP